jgi:hypothetical protein
MIMKKNAIGLAVLGVLASLMLTTAWGQDFQRSYQLAPGDRISVSIASGEISITGYNGSTVSVTAFREGPDKDAVEIQDQSSPGHVSLTVQYPRSGSYHASVRFVIQVPRASGYQFDSLSSASGDISITDVTGDIKTKTASGDVRVKAPAQLNAQVEMSTASGSIKTDFPLTIEDLDHHGKKAYGQVGSGAIKLKISTASGDVQLIRS